MAVARGARSLRRSLAGLPTFERNKAQKGDLGADRANLHADIGCETKRRRRCYADARADRGYYDPDDPENQEGLKHRNNVVISKRPAPRLPIRFRSAQP